MTFSSRSVTFPRHKKRDGASTCFHVEQDGNNAVKRLVRWDLHCTSYARLRDAVGGTSERWSRASDCRGIKSHPRSLFTANCRLKYGKAACDGRESAVRYDRIKRRKITTSRNDHEELSWRTKFTVSYECQKRVFPRILWTRLWFGFKKIWKVSSIYGIPF